MDERGVGTNWGPVERTRTTDNFTEMTVVVTVRTVMSKPRGWSRFDPVLREEVKCLNHSPRYLPAAQKVQNSEVSHEVPRELFVVNVQ